MREKVGEISKIEDFSPFRGEFESRARSRAAPSLYDIIYHIYLITRGFFGST